MKSLLAFFLVFLYSCSTASCSHVSTTARSLPRTPPSVGFYALVRPARAVRCVLDKDMTVDMCNEVAKACDKINSAVGFELLAPPTITDAAGIMNSKAEDEVTYVYVDHPSAIAEGAENALGVTIPNQYEIGTGYLRRVIVVLDPGIWMSQEEREAVVLHELFHSVGADHAAQKSAFNSVIRPSWEPSAPTELTPGDAAALRAAYPHT